MLFRFFRLNIETQQSLLFFFSSTSSSSLFNCTAFISSVDMPLNNPDNFTSQLVFSSLTRIAVASVSWPTICSFDSDPHFAKQHHKYLDKFSDFSSSLHSSINDFSALMYLFCTFCFFK